MVSLDFSFHQLSVHRKFVKFRVHWPFSLTYYRALFILHQISNVDFWGQLLSIYKSKFDHFYLFRFLWFLAFYWYINWKIWISFDSSIWRFPLRCSFRGFSDIWFSIIHIKSISYPKIMNSISINSIFSLVFKYIIFVIFWHLLILWFYRTPTVCQSQHFDFDFWLFFVKSENWILKNFYLIYLYDLYLSNLIFTSLKPLLNLSLTKSTLQLKSTLLSVDRHDTYILLNFISYLCEFGFINFIWPTFLCFINRTKTLRHGLMLRWC